MEPSHVSDIARVIQLSVAPVFLLTAIGTILGVLSTRLGRIVDRARVLRDRLAVAPRDAAEALRTEMRLLARRRHLVNFAISAGVCAALFVCVLIASAFIGSLLRFHVANFMATLFVAAMAAFVTALLAFLREVVLAASGLRIDPD